MEQIKGGYCNLSKLRVEKTDEITGQKFEEEIIEPKEIRDEIKNFYQKILAKRALMIF